MNEQYFTGTRITIVLDDLRIDISTATSVLVLYRKPTGQRGEWVADKFGDSIRYTTLTTDMTVPGKWQLQACAVFGTERKPGRICPLILYSPLN